MMSRSERTTKYKGFGLIEVLIAVVIVTVTFFSFFAVFQSALVLARTNLRATQSSFLLEEGVEAAKTVRDAAWANVAALTTSTTYYLRWNGTAWEFTATPNTIDGIFTRTIILGDVYRDSNDDIAVSGTLDDGTRHVAVSVSWQDGGETRERALETYITNIANE